jgi:hypothetical protein
MGLGWRRAVWFGLTLLAAGEAFAGEDAAARVEKAREAARANAASTQGREWMHRNSSAMGRLLIPVLNGCLPEPAGDIPTAFSVYVRLSAKGRVREIVTELDAALGRCMTTAAQALQFPEAPRDDYWVQLNLAAPL